MTRQQPAAAQSAITPTGRWLQDQLHDDATAFHAMTSGRFGIGSLVVKVQDAIPQIEAEAAAPQPAEAVKLLEKAAQVADLHAERLKYTSHRDGLGMGWQEGEEVCRYIAAGIRALANQADPLPEGTGQQPVAERQP